MQGIPVGRHVHRQYPFDAIAFEKEDQGDQVICGAAQAGGGPAADPDAGPGGQGRSRGLLAPGKTEGEFDHVPGGGKPVGGHGQQQDFGWLPGNNRPAGKGFDGAQVDRAPPFPDQPGQPPADPVGIPGAAGKIQRPVSESLVIPGHLIIGAVPLSPFKPIFDCRKPGGQSQ